MVPTRGSSTARTSAARIAALAVAAAGLVSQVTGCGESPNPTAPGGGASGAASGQVVSGTAPEVPYHAAARFLEQASFGATPASIERVRRLGMAAWIDEQLSAPTTPIDGTWLKSAARTSEDQSRLGPRYWNFFVERFFERALAGNDQLRLRVAWALFQFIVISDRKVQPYALVTFFNMLQRNATGNYATLLREVSTDSAMGFYLDNDQNRPAGACPNCAPNENYARELMQLFALGVNRLSADGTIVRDAQGKPVPTYGQEDVEELARALTGWEHVQEPDLPFSNWANFDKPLVPSGWGGAHDRGEKKLLGETIPGGGDARADLEAVIAILARHRNIAPFVATRLIQHLTTSNPTPAYVARVAEAFRNDGTGVAGNLAAVVKAVLLDPEARKGDSPGAIDPRFGKIREPVLWHAALLRGLGCTALPATPWGNRSAFTPGEQRPGSAPSVFSFYLPSDRAPGSGLLAPEQRLLTSNEFSNRLGALTGIVGQDPGLLSAAGCDLDEFVRAYEQSPRQMTALIGERYFRGAMSPPLREAVAQMTTSLTWASKREQAVTGLLLALSSPSFGVMR